MRSVKFYTLLLIIGIASFSCSKDDFEAEIPAYISIDKFSLTTNQNQGSASENITDAWVYINDDLIGVFELPAKFPVLKEGTVNLKVFAGIKENGIAATRVKYIPYAPYEKQITLVKEETISVEPIVRYHESIQFPWIQDFEGAALDFSHHVSSDTVIKSQIIDVKEGDFSGLISLDPDMIFFEMTSPAQTNIPLTGTPVYLELDFKNNQEMTIGVYLDANQFAFLTLGVSTEWKKIYINLADVINKNNTGTNELKVFFGMQESSTSIFTTNPEIYIDNVKLVHF